MDRIVPAGAALLLDLAREAETERGSRTGSFHASALANDIYSVASLELEMYCY